MLACLDIGLTRLSVTVWIVAFLTPISTQVFVAAHGTEPCFALGRAGQPNQCPEG